jgi:chemotaxis methyl-accepting protein methylase
LASWELKDEALAIKLLKRLQHELVLRFQPRKSTSYTHFYRFHHQYSVLFERVLPHLAADRLDIVLFGCSTGAEPYSLASLLTSRCPSLDFGIRAFDIEPELIAIARRATYSRRDVYRSPFINEEFVGHTFDVVGTSYRVKDAITSRVDFAVGSVLDAVLIDNLGKADLVLAQNVLFHLKPRVARRAFANLVKLLRDKSALFVDGMDTRMRIALTKQFHLEPVNYKVEEVHNDAYINRKNRRVSRYFDREPFSLESNEWLRKYCTVYLQGNRRSSPEGAASVFTRPAGAGVAMAD